MTIALAERTIRIQPSATMAVNAKATQLRNEGIDIINLSVGEPDFNTPDFIKNAAIQAIQDNVTRYTPADGLPALKTAIIEKFKRDNQLDYNAKQLLITAGAKQALYNATQALLKAGDEAIIPAPYWVSYPAMVQLADAKPVFITADIAQRFKITAEQLKSALTSKTRVLFLNSPSNPTGMIYSPEEFRAIGDVLKNYPDVTVITDDIYEYIVWDEAKFSSFLNACPELFDRTVTINGASKAYAMTGWRLGYSAAPEAITAAMKKIQSHSTSCACSISQMAAIAALKADRSQYLPMYDAFKARHDKVLAGLQKIETISVMPADGAFYLYPNVQAAIEKLGLEDDIALANFLLEKAHVATVPGTAFGTPGYLRISCAESAENLMKAVDRMEKVL